MLSLLQTLSFYSMLVGYGFMLVMFVRDKKFKQIFYSLIIPFYLFYCVLHLKEDNVKKYASIFILGAFIIYIFASVFLVLMTPVP